MCQAVPESNKPSKCPQDFDTTCSLQCANNQYAVDKVGCPICACASQSSANICPLLKCQNNCGELGYKSNSNGCRTCECASKSSKVECSRVMCRMFCAHGFRRDENGCEICSCNSSPQPCPKLTCNNICLNGYRKDYSGCQTCNCNDEIVHDLCPAMKCDLDCKYGFERDASGCSLCSCNKCPIHTCRQFCMYGFQKNSDGCDVCECDWSPIAEKISCSERIPCKDNRVCNLNLKYCELVDPEKVNWFVYDFDIKSKLFSDSQFVKTFKTDLINNIAEKYDLEKTQITVSSVEDNGMASFQVMPFFIESPEDFQKKMDKIDIDLNSHEFRSVLPSVARQIDRQTSKTVDSFWTRYIQPHSSLALYIVAVCIGIVALFFATIFFLMVRYRLRHPGRSESKSPIYDTSYHQAPTEDDQYRAVHAPDGTAYVVVENDDMHSSNDCRALV